LAKLEIELKGAELPNGMILWPKPCPALDESKSSGKCLIYEDRPYPCRTFLCGKNSTGDRKPWRPNGSFNMDYFKWLIKNNKEFAKIKEKIEDNAAIWGLKYGWKIEKYQERVNKP